MRISQRHEQPIAIVYPFSLDLVEISMEIEGQFHITLNDDELADMPDETTLRDLLATIEGKLPGDERVARGTGLM